MTFFFTKSREKSLATLSSIVLVAVSEEAYLAAAQTPNLLGQLLQDGRVLRQGDSFQTDYSFVYTLWSLEPVSQGRALAGRTEIIVLSPSHPIVFNRNDVNVTNDTDFIEIDEGFLAASSETWQGKGQPLSSNTACVGRSEAPAYEFSFRDLDTPEDLQDDNFSLYLRTPDLGKIGILSHDWVCTQQTESIRDSTCFQAIAYARLPQSRLVRIVANDNLVNSQCVESRSSPGDRG